MKRLIATIALALLIVPATFAGEQSFLERVAVYLAPPSIGAYEFDGDPRTVRKVTEMLPLLAFKGLDSERYESHAYRTEQPWVGRGIIR